MKASEDFKAVIQQHLNEVAANDSLFAETLKKEGKNINDCLTYVLNCAKNGGCVGYSDAEVFGWAVHYYDEDSIDIGKPLNAKVVVNKPVELSPEDIAKAKQDALDKVVADEMARLKEKRTKKQTSVLPDDVQPSLF